MKAAVLKQFGQPLAIETLPDPVLGTGEVIVDVAAAGVAGYAAEVFSGVREYRMELPIVPGPGGIGRIRATGPDTTRLAPGDWVFCDPTIRARDLAGDPDSILLGWTARTAAARPLHRHYHDGSYAEQVLVPAENVAPLGEIDPAEASRWCALSLLLVPYGGLLAGGLRPGETIVINGATGGFGAAAVAVAVAMGAGKVVATGRNEESLRGLVERHGSRVVPARMSGVEAEDRGVIADLADGPVDRVLDLLPRAAAASQVRAAVLTVRAAGSVVLMGGVGNGEDPQLSLPYDWFVDRGVTVTGQWMYPPDAILSMIRMIRCGLIDLTPYVIAEFGLDEVNDAVAHAAADAGPSRLTVLRPDRTTSARR